jgi:hypothetical protein
MDLITKVETNLKSPANVDTLLYANALQNSKHKVSRGLNTLCLLLSTIQHKGVNRRELGQFLSAGIYPCFRLPRFHMGKEHPFC